ncbi:MAG: F0F1 ATP synthase subunit delta [Chloroflexota bacterium]|nr:F0F1 ATP synthase subunit delta [Chloroflexota bacterium]
MLNLDVWTILFQIINFLILAAALYYLLFRPVMRNVEQRAAEKEQLARELARERQEAANLRAELEERLAHSEEEAATIVAAAREQAEADRRALLQEAHAEVERILVEAHTDTQRLRQQTVDESHDDLLDAILEISGSVIGRTAPPEVHDALVQQLCDRIWELGRSEMDRVETFRRALGDRTPTAYVTAARPLSPEQQGLLARTFTALADRHVNLELKTDPALAAGIQVRLGDTLVDNSIGGQLAEMRETVLKILEERVTGE